ncbi:MAG: acyltransferase, partial [Bacteroidales bacterium]|nr:acyltransferase [Bacteroidales bacterium]
LTIRSFTREETTFLKGVAILLIALHNYYRWILPITGENEFWFSPLAINKSWIILRSNPLEFFHVFFNFLGHYGVQAFIVVSAYGLTLSYQKARPAYGKFVLHRFNKLYPSLILAGICFIIFTLFTTGNLIGMNSLKDLGIQFTLFANLVPGKAMVITGPWWFYSFIFQFYLVFPLMLWIHRKAGWMGLVGMVIAGYLFTILLYRPMNQVDLNPYMTFMGHLPELCLGIFLASRDKIKLPWWLFVLALMVFIGGNIYQWLWPFANLAVALLLVVAIQGMIRIKARIKGFYTLVSSVGVISMYLFAVHGILRFPFLGLANALGNSATSLLIGILFVVVACGVALLLMHTESAARKWVIVKGDQKRTALRLLVLVFLVVGGFALLFVREYRRQADAVQRKEVVAFQGIRDFEAPIPGRWDLLTDSLAMSGERSLILDNNRAFSAGFMVYFDSIDLTGIFELEITSWLYTTDPATSLHLVMEIWDKPSGIQVEWQSEYIRPNTYQTDEWFQKRFVYQIPAEFRRSNYYVRVYAWKPSQGTWYLDDLTLRIKAKRESP